MNALRLTFFVRQNMTYNRIAHQRKSSGSSGCRQSHRRAVKVRCGVAPALALIAVVARRAPIVRHGQIRNSIRHKPPTEPLFDHPFRQHFAAGEIHRRQKFSVGHLRQPFMGCAYADIAFHPVVVRLELRVTERPVLLVAIAARGLEFIVAVAIAFTRPAKCFSADLPSTNPHERLVGRKRVRVLVVVHKKLAAVFVAGIAKALHRLVYQQLF